MPTLLGLDIGKRRTGVAFALLPEGFVFAIDTIKHTSVEELIEKLKIIVAAKKPTEFIIGLPKLLDGTEGEQAGIVRSYAARISDALKIPVEFVDERYTTVSTDTKEVADARAACSILTVIVDRRKNDY